MDERIKKLSNTIVNYSVSVKENDRVLIQYESKECSPLVKCLIKDIYKNKGIPFVKLIDNEINTLILENSNSKVIDEMVKMKSYEVDNFDCFIRICYTENEYEDKNLDSEIRKELGSKSQEIDDVRINQRRWVLLNYPSLIDAYKAKMKYDDFYDYSMDVMNVDYKSLNEKIIPLKELMEKTGGIVQGMSGSPIVQNGRLIGAVTHVIVDNPMTGYGILITTMLENGDKIKNNQ